MKKRKSLSDREQQLLSELSSQDISIIDLEAIQKTLDVSYDVARSIARNLVEKKWLDRLEPGKYLILPLAAGEEGEYTEHEFIIAANLVEKGYISYWSALDYFGWTEQMPMTVFVATNKQKSDRNIHGAKYKFVKLSEEKLFGFELYSIGSQKVPIALPEKAIVDCADHPEYCGGVRELIKAFDRAKDELDYHRLIDFLVDQGNGAAIKRIVYLSDVLDIRLPDRRWLEDQFTSGYVKLDPSVDREGRHDSDYNLQINISRDELLREVGI